MKRIVETLHRLRFLSGLAVRNLARQRRRSLLLGAAIGFGMTVLVLMNSFTAGLTDILLNHVLVWMTGHMEVAVTEKSSFKGPMIRDRNAWLATISNEIPDLREIRENVGIFARVIGNGKADNLILVGVPAHDIGISSTSSMFDVASGNLDDLTNAGTAAIYEEKAAKLKVKLGDAVNAKFQQVQGAYNTGTYRIVAILRNQSFVMNMVLYTDLEPLKKQMGYLPRETRGLQVILRKATEAPAIADRLHRRMTPPAAVVEVGSPDGKGEPVTLWAIRTNVAGRSGTTGDPGLAAAVSNLADGRMALTKKAAELLGAKEGKSLRLRYRDAFGSNRVFEANVGAVVEIGGGFPETGAILRESEWHRALTQAPPSAERAALLTGKSNALAGLWSPLYELLPRSGTMEELQAKNIRSSANPLLGHRVDIRTMYETGSQILKIEQALNVITLQAVLILFFIILIGVVNSLRMAIRERTREIGTVRAMGMHANDIRNMFVLETVFLALFACLAGIAFAGLVMFGLHQIRIVTDSPMGLFLLEKHLHFVIKPLSLVSSLALILGLTAVTAWFPARKAARLSPAEALRHHE